MTTPPRGPGVFCRHAGVCGGCSLLHLSYREQIASKEAALRRLFAGRLPADAGTRPMFATSAANAALPERFRQKVAFVFGAGPGGKGLVMGHFERGSQRIVPVEECPVHSARANRIAFALRDHLAAAGIGAAGSAVRDAGRRGRGARAGRTAQSAVLRHLLVRATADDREAVAMLVVTRNDRALRRPVRALLESNERPDGFFVNVNEDPGPFMVGDTTLRIDGVRHVRERVGGVSFLVSPTAFFQTNVGAAAVLQELVVRSVAGAQRVLDLYCGSGLLTLPIASSGATVTGIEENLQAIHDAKENARLNRVPEGRVRFVAGRVDEALRRMKPSRWDAVVLDPPRQGCGAAVVDVVFREIAPARVTYVSCNPDALLNELPAIEAAGYRIAAFDAVDMFPHTDHVEAVVQFRRAAGGRTSRAAS